jgi:hypothetical protein
MPDTSADGGVDYPFLFIIACMEMMLLTTASWPVRAVTSSFSSAKLLIRITVEFGRKVTAEERRAMIVTEKLWRLSAFGM